MNHISDKESDRFSLIWIRQWVLAQSQRRRGSSYAATVYAPWLPSLPVSHCRPDPPCLACPHVCGSLHPLRPAHRHYVIMTITAAIRVQGNSGSKTILKITMEFFTQKTRLIIIIPKIIAEFIELFERLKALYN